MRKNSGFTLIELVIVIIVLGILAATAVPKFINLQDDAKVSALRGAEAAIHSAANIVYSKAAIDGVEREASDDITDNGTTIDTVYGYPAATEDGIVESVELTGFRHETGNDGYIFWQGDASSSVPTGNNCTVTYKAATSGARYTVETDADCS